MTNDDSRQDMKHDSRQRHYLLRPEAVETFFVLHQLTGDPIYREWGWEIFLSIDYYCKTKYGYGSFPNVNDVNGNIKDEMESFFLAETLKYLYLLMDPDTEVDILHKVSLFMLWEMLGIPWTSNTSIPIYFLFDTFFHLFISNFSISFLLSNIYSLKTFLACI